MPVNTSTPGVPSGTPGRVQPVMPIGHNLLDNARDVRQANDGGLLNSDGDVITSSGVVISSSLTSSSTTTAASSAAVKALKDAADAHNAAADPHSGYVTAAELATALAGVSAGAPTQVAFSTTWDAAASKIINAPYTVTGALAMVGTQTGSVPGGFTSGVLIANGTNIPTFNGTAASAWNNTNGARNTVTYTEEVEGVHYWYVNGSRLYCPASGNAVEEVSPAPGGAGTTYTLSKAGDTLTLTPSTGTAQSVDLSEYANATELTAALNGKLGIATAATYSTTWDTSDINGKWLPSQTPGANFTLTESTTGSVAGGGTACWFTPTANITATIGGVAYSWTAGTSYSVLLLKHRGDEAARWSVSGGGGVAVPAPVIATAPTVSLSSGTANTVGAVYAVSNGTWTNSPTGYTYLWSRSPTGAAGTWVAISGATAATYTLVSADVGNYVRATVGASNAGGNSAANAATDIGPVVAAPAAATAVTLTGPTTSTAGAASTDYTVGADGTITGTVVVTPTPVAGVTFAPASVSISSGTPTAAFTATVAAASTVSIAVTNNGGLTNPSAISLTASAAAGAAPLTNILTLSGGATSGAGGAYSANGSGAGTSTASSASAAGDYELILLVPGAAVTTGYVELSSRDDAYAGPGIWLRRSATEIATGWGTQVTGLTAGSDYEIRVTRVGTLSRCWYRLAGGGAWTRVNQPGDDTALTGTRRPSIAFSTSSAGATVTLSGAGFA